MTADSASGREESGSHALGLVPTRAWYGRLSRTMVFKSAVLAAFAALLGGVVVILFVVRSAERLPVAPDPAAVPLAQPVVADAPGPLERRAWWLVATAAVVSTLAGAGLGAAHLHAQRRLRRRARRMLDADASPADGWPVGGGEVGELAAVLRQVALSHAHAMASRLTKVQQLQAILANASVGIMITRNGRFDLVGRQLCQMFGYTEGELLGQRTATIYQSDEAYVELGPRMRADLTAHGHFDGELIMRRKNGREFWVHMLGRAVIPGDSSGGTIWILEDISQAREARDQLSWTATHDSLTGLVNRKEFEARLDHAMTQFNRHNVCAMFIDLDRFKAVNDSAGHAAGDEVLRAVAALFEAAVRQSDSVGRLGGDEFAILLPGCPLPRAQTIAENVRTAVEAYRLQAGDQVLAIGASIGVVEVTADMPSIAAVLHAADAACYEAKRGGRNRVVTYQGALQPAQAAPAATPT